MPAPTAPVEAVRHQLRAPDDDFTGNVVLTGAAKTITKPAGARWLHLTASALTYYRFGGSAAVVPAADTTTGGSLPLSPGNGLLYDMGAKASVSVNSAAAVIGYTFYRDEGLS